MAFSVDTAQCRVNTLYTSLAHYYILRAATGGSFKNLHTKQQKKQSWQLQPNSESVNGMTLRPNSPYETLKYFLCLIIDSCYHTPTLYICTYTSSLSKTE